MQHFIRGRHIGTADILLPVILVELVHFLSHLIEIASGHHAGFGQQIDRISPHTCITKIIDIFSGHLVCIAHGTLNHFLGNGKALLSCRLQEMQCVHADFG